MQHEDLCPGKLGAAGLLDPAYGVGGGAQSGLQLGPGIRGNNQPGSGGRGDCRPDQHQHGREAAGHTQETTRRGAWFLRDTVQFPLTHLEGCTKCRKQVADRLGADGEPNQVGLQPGLADAGATWL